MKERALMASFFAGGLAGVGITSLGLSMGGFKEAGVIASGLVEEGRFDDAVIVRIGVTVLMTGLYAILKERDSEFAPSLEKSLQISNVIVWAVDLLSAMQIVYEIVPKG